MIQITGNLVCSIGNEGFKLIVEVDPELGRFYRSLIPKYLHPQPTRYAPHITVVRKEVPLVEAWSHLDSSQINFSYDPEIRYNDVYFWLRCWSTTLLKLRLGMGLPEHTEYTRPPDGEECFHCTVANTKAKR